MAKTRNLNGLPGNLALSYLSTLGYYDGGYMADWINYIARDKKIVEIKIDILNKSIEPKIAEIKPLISNLNKLKGIIYAELKNNGFENSFIKKAILKFKIPINSATVKRTIYCYPILEDENGKTYESKKRIVETAYEVDFNPIKKVEIKIEETKHTLIEKIKAIFK